MTPPRGDCYYNPPMPRSTRARPASAGPAGYTADWHAVRLAALARGRWACHRCGDADPLAMGEQRLSPLLHVHHRDRNKTNNDPANLEVLCRRCHWTEHGRPWYPHWPAKRPRGRGRLRIRMRDDPAERNDPCGNS